MKVRLTFIEESLGSTPAKENLLRDYIASKSSDPVKIEEEIAAHGVQAVEDDRMTVFPRMADGRPIFWDYQIKGFFKDSWQMLAKAGKAGYEGGQACAGIKAYKKTIDGLIFVFPRQIPVDLHGMKMDTCERPLRASTPMGERTSIAKSESVPDGSTLEFEITCLDPHLEECVIECLNYGKLRGLSQWRNSGKGRFTWERLDEPDEKPAKKRGRKKAAETTEESAEV